MIEEELKRDRQKLVEWRGYLEIHWQEYLRLDALFKRLRNTQILTALNKKKWKERNEELDQLALARRSEKQWIQSAEARVSALTESVELKERYIQQGLEREAAERKEVEERKAQRERERKELEEKLERRRAIRMKRRLRR